VEHEDRELAGAARSAHVLHVMPRFGAASARVLAAALERLAEDADGAGIALLVIAPDRDSAYRSAEMSAAEPGGEVRLAPLTATARAARLLQRNPRAAVGTPRDLGVLVRGATLKLDRVKHVVILWPDAILADEGALADLETLLAELPRDADRSVFTEQVSPLLEKFVERSGARPRRLVHDAAETPQPLPLDVQYVLVAPEQRSAVLQRVVDAHDATDLAVVADDPAAALDARHSLQTLGMRIPEDARIISSGDAATGTLVLWYGLPHLDQLAAQGSASVLLLATPAELRQMRDWATARGWTLTPHVLPQRSDDAARRQQAMRDELAALLRRESVDAELATIEPLLAQHDAVELAAAALRLLSRARVRAEQAAAAAPRPAATAQAPRAPAAGDQSWTRLFLSVGERDGARRGDLVGAIAGESGITGAQIGKIDLRDTHALVEVANDVAERVIERLTGAVIRGRRVTVRIDRGGGRPGAEPRRGPPRRDHADRPVPGERAPRAVREHEEWSSRGERLRHARRPPSSDMES
jgi:ATP-dependent RNA helicase DeaD